MVCMAWGLKVALGLSESESVVTESKRGLRRRRTVTTNIVPGRQRPSRV